MRDSARSYSGVCLSGIAVAALLPLLPFSNALGSDVPDFSGVWIEVQPVSGPPLRLQLTQSGSRVQVRSSFRDSFPDAVLGVATIENGSAAWTLSQSCIARFRWPGYNYDNPGVNTFTLSLGLPADPGQSGPLLAYVQETHWNVPCANNHPIGNERIQRILRRQ